MKASDFHLDDEQLDHIFDRPDDHPDKSLTVREFVFGSHPSGIDEPALVLVGGQPGAGKSRAIAAVARRRSEELVPLSGDDLRPFHPAFETLARDNPWLMPNATSQASGAWVRRCLDYAIDHRHSLLLEGVFRDPLTVAQTIDRFAKKGYQVEVVGLAVPYRDSLLSTLGRFLHPADDEVARWTPATAHDSAYRMIPSTLQAAEDTKSTQRLHVTNRQGEDLFTNTRTPTGTWENQTPGAAVAATKVARDAPISPEAANAWLKGYVVGTRELAVRGQLNEVTRPTVEYLGRIADHAATVAFPHDAQAREMLSEHLTRLEQAPDTAVDFRDEELDARLDGWASDKPASTESGQQHEVGAPGQETDLELADRVVVDGLRAQRGDRAASRFDMLLAGMSEEETTAAIASWEALGKPETAQEREVRLRAEQATPEGNERASHVAKAPERSKEPPASFGSPEETLESHQGTDTEGEERTASAIWETPKPSMMSLAALRTEWAVYDDRHGYGRRPQTLSVKTPSKAPGAYAALLHPNTIAVYERDQRQNEADGYQPGG